MSRLILLSALLFSALTTHAANSVWGKTTGNWNDASGWSSGRVPGPDELVEIGIFCEVVVTTDVFVGQIFVNGQGKINVAQTGILHVNHSEGLGAIRMLDKSKLTVSGQLVLGDRSPLNGDGIVGTFYNSFRWESPDIIVNKTGSISIGNVKGIAIMLFTGGSITNNGKIEIGSLGPISYYNNPNLVSAGILTVAAKIVNTGVITVDDVEENPASPNKSAGILAAAGMVNSGQVKIGQKKRIAGIAMAVNDSTENSGLIQIDNARDGLSADTLVNTGQILIGQNGSMAGRGIFQQIQSPRIINQGDILIDRVTSGDAISLSGATIINYKNILVGKSGPLARSGIGLSSSMIDNRENGLIQIQNCKSHNLRLWGNSNVSNAGRIEMGGNNNDANDAINLDNSTLTNNATGWVQVDRAKRNGIHLLKGRFENSGTLKLMKTDSIPVLLQNTSVFNNYGTVDGLASEGPFSGGIAVTEGSVFDNRLSASVILNRAAPLFNVPIIYVRDENSRLINRASLKIADSPAPSPFHAIQVDQKASFSNQPEGLVKVGRTGQNAVTVSNTSRFTNAGTIELANVQGIAFYAFNQSQIDNDGAIRTGVGSVLSKESIYLDAGTSFNNRSHGEIYVNRTGSAFTGLLVKGGSAFQNDGKVVWGNEVAFQGSKALQLANAGSFSNKGSGILEFWSCTGDAIVCDAVTGASPNSSFVNDATVRFGNISGRGFYNTDPTFVFRNNNVFETMAGGKMNLQALVHNATPSSKLNNADGTVTTALAFTNSGTVTNGGAFNSQGIFTNGGTIVNNGTWNANAAFDNNNRFQGSGVFQGVVFNNKSTLAPGNSPGCVTFGNGFTAQSGSILRMEVNGKNSPCTDFDQVNVIGTAALTGALNITIGGGYTPGELDAVTILKSTTLTGTFTTQNLPAGWSLVYNRPSTGDVTLIRTAALPLRLVQFAVQKEGSRAYASWTTTEEVNTSHFDLERSADGSLFQKIATITAINAAGDHRYDFTDNNPLPGRSYYRLKMADIDGTYTHSRIVSFDGEKAGAVISAIYPNPAKDMINLGFAENTSDLTIQLVSLTGKVMLIKRPNTVGLLSLDLSGIPAGIYFIKTSNGETYKFVKQ